MTTPEADDARKLLEASEAGLQNANAHADELEDVLARRAAVLEERLSALKLREGATRVSVEDLAAFFERPYSILPRDAESVWVVAPRFARGHYGHLDHSEGSYNWFITNRATLLFGDVPKDVERYLRHHPPVRALIQEGALVAATERDMDEAWGRYARYLTLRESPLRALVKNGREFELTNALIRDGTLPFVPKLVSPQHLRPGEWMHQSKIVLRDYQQDAWNKFLQLGAVGVYWPTGGGKTGIALHAMAHLTGRKVVFVPTTTLREQWLERIGKHLDWGAQKEVRVATYQSFDKVWEEEKDITLTVYDECHTIAADTYAQCATLPTQYRMGLSATPYREDGQESLIFSLTGFPLPTEWEKLQLDGIVTLPDIKLIVCRSMEHKFVVAERLLRPEGADKPRAVVFSDSIPVGEEVARRLVIPFVHGNTKGRKLDAIRAARQVVVSRVGDEGMSLDDLDLVVEVDFHGKSRRQEIQRMGRLMHSKGAGRHFILMTEEELVTNDKRLSTYREKGIRVMVERAE